MRKAKKMMLAALSVAALCSCGQASGAAAVGSDGWDESASSISLRLGEYSAVYSKDSEWDSKKLVRWRDDGGVVTVETPISSHVFRGWAYVADYKK